MNALNILSFKNFEDLSNGKFCQFISAFPNVHVHHLMPHDDDSRKKFFQEKLICQVT